MKLKKRVTKNRKIGRLGASGGGTGTFHGQRRAVIERKNLGKRARELKEWRTVAKKRVTVNLDADVLAWFRGMGRGYQWEINRTLRRVMEEEAKVREG